MKTFLTVFFAGLCALAVAYFGVRLFERSEAWNAEKANELQTLGSYKNRLRDARVEVRPDMSKMEAEGIQDAISNAQDRCKACEIDLLDFYAHKPLPLSNEEKRQAAEWRRDVGTPR